MTACCFEMLVRAALRAVVLSLLYVGCVSVSRINVSTIAGSGASSSVNGNGTSASFHRPIATAYDRCRKLVYVSDHYSHLIRRVRLDTAAVDTLASGFSSPWSLALSADCSYLYVGNYLANSIARVTLPGGTWSAVHASPTVTTPLGIDITPSGNIVVAGYKTKQIGLLNVATGVYTVVKTMSTDQFGVASDTQGNIYVADTRAHCIRRIVPSTGVMTDVAGLCSTSGCVDGIGTAARLTEPAGIRVYESTTLIVAEWNGCRVLSVTLTGVVTTLAGQCGVSGNVDGYGTNALFGNMYNVAVDLGMIYIPDFDNNRLRTITGLSQRSASATGTAGASLSPTPRQTSTLSRELNSPTLFSSQRSSTSTTTRNPQSHSFTATATRQVHSATAAEGRSATHTTLSTVSPALAPTSSSTTSRSSTIVFSGLTIRSSVSSSPSCTLSSLCAIDACRLCSPPPSWADASAAGALVLNPEVGGRGGPWVASPLPNDVAVSGDRSPLVLFFDCLSYMVFVEPRHVTTSAGTSVDVSSKQHGSVTEVILRLPNASTSTWLPTGALPYRSQNSISLRMAVYCNGLQHVNVAVPVLRPPPLPVVAVVDAAGAGLQWTSTISGVTSALSIGRVAASRRVVMCTPEGASAGGFLGWSIADSADGGTDEAVAYARGAIVGNAAVLLTAVTCIASVGVAYARYTHAAYRVGLLRVALPSSLLPVWTALLQGVAGAVPLVAVSDAPRDAWYVACGVLVVLAPLCMLVLASVRSASTLRCCPLVQPPQTSESSAASSPYCCVAASRAIRSRARRSFEWRDSDLSPLPPSARAMWLLLLEYRVLPYAVLDTCLLIAASVLGTIAGLGSLLQCRVAAGLTLGLYVAQLLVCVRVRPYTSPLFGTFGVACLLCSCVCLAVQLASVATGASASPSPAILFVTSSLELVVFGLALCKQVLIDLGTLLRAALRVVADGKVARRAAVDTQEVPGVERFADPAVEVIQSIPTPQPVDPNVALTPAEDVDFIALEDLMNACEWRSDTLSVNESRCADEGLLTGAAFFGDLSGTPRAHRRQSYTMLHEGDQQ